MFIVSSCSGPCPIHWSQVLSWEWRCIWSSGDRRCSNYIWVINNFIAYQGVTYTRGFTGIIIGCCCLWGLKHTTNSDILVLTHWGQVKHICISKLTITGSGNGLSPEWHQAIIWTNAGILSIETLGTNFSEILNEIHKFSFKKMYLKMSSKWQPFCLGLNVLNTTGSHCNNNKNTI